MDHLKSEIAKENVACAIHGLDVAIEHLEFLCFNTTKYALVTINGFRLAANELKSLKKGMTQHDNSGSSTQISLDSNR